MRTSSLLKSKEAAARESFFHVRVPFKKLQNEQSGILEKVIAIICKSSKRRILSCKGMAKIMAKILNLKKNPNPNYHPLSLCSKD